MSCYMYILFSQSRNKFYVGHTCEELEERMRKHHSNHSGYTGCAGDWKIAYHESFPDKLAAYNREREVKAWKSRTRIEQLVNKS